MMPETFNRSIKVPILLHPSKSGGYCVNIPSINGYTEGETIEECLFMARDYMAARYSCINEDSRVESEFYMLNALREDHAGDAMLQFVEIDALVDCWDNVVAYDFNEDDDVPDDILIHQAESRWEWEDRNIKAYNNNDEETDE